MSLDNIQDLIELQCQALELAKSKPHLAEFYNNLKISLMDLELILTKLKIEEMKKKG